MPIIKGTVTSSGTGANTTVGTVATGLTVDGRVGWNITRFAVFFSNMYIQVPGDMEHDVYLQTIATLTTSDSDDVIARCSFGTAITGAADVGFQCFPENEVVLFEPRLTVQDSIYVLSRNVVGSTTAPVIYYEINYEVVKLTDLELLRLLVGGA